MDKQNLNLILMPTFSCNMVCDYCYVVYKKPGVMDIYLAKSAIEQSMNLNDSSLPTNVYWHGAEPLIAGIDFYSKIFEWTEENFGLDTVRHHIQTNGTLLNEHWYDIFIKHHITVGVSLDGPMILHDRHRKVKSREGSFDVVFSNISEARKRKLYFDVLCVISRDTLDHIDELFNFFWENKIDFGVEPLICEDQTQQAELGITPQEYALVITHLFDRWFYQVDRKIKNFVPAYHYVHSLLTGVNSYCNFSKCCSTHYLAVSPDGDVYSCIMFAGHPEYSFGNLKKQNMKDILASDVRKPFLSPRVELIRECQQCKWTNLCNAGCPHNALIKNGHMLAPDFFCESYKTIFSHVENALLKELGISSRTEALVAGNSQITKA